MRCNTRNQFNNHYSIARSMSNKSALNSGGFKFQLIIVKWESITVGTKFMSIHCQTQISTFTAFSGTISSLPYFVSAVFGNEINLNFAYLEKMIVPGQCSCLSKLHDYICVSVIKKFNKIQIRDRYICFLRMVTNRDFCSSYLSWTVQFCTYSYIY